MRYPIVIFRTYILFTVWFSISCGEDAPNTPPVDEWCDLERPREDCELFDARIESLEDMAAICESPCTKISLLAIENNVDKEILKGLNGFTYIQSASIVSTHSNVKDLSFLSDVKEMQALVVMDNPGLESLAGLEGVEFVKPCEMCPRRIEIAANPNLRSIGGLDALTAVETIRIADHSKLEVIDGFDNLQTALIEITTNEGLKRIVGFKNMVNSLGIVITANPRLQRLELWPNLKTLRGIRLDRNRSLNMCDVDRILDQLDEPPELIDIKDTNGPPCAQ